MDAPRTVGRDGIAAAAVPSIAVPAVQSDPTKDPQHTSVPVLRAFVNLAANMADQTIVAAVTGKKIRVVTMIAQAGSSATDMTLLSNASAIGPLMANGANGGAVLHWNPAGWAETAASEALKATTSAGSPTGVIVLYALIP